MDDLFCDLYRTLQRQFTMLEPLLIRSGEELEVAQREAVKDLYELFSLSSSSVSLNDVAETSQIESLYQGRDLLSQFSLLKAVDEVLHSRHKNAVLAQAITRLTDRDRWVVVPDAIPALSGLYPSKARPRYKQIARKDSRSVNDWLEHHRLVRVPPDFGVDVFPILARSNLTEDPNLREVAEELARAYPMIKVACLNFGSIRSEFSLAETNARGRWGHIEIGETFRFSGVEASALARLSDELGTLLEQCTDEQCHIVVLPELTVPPELRRTISDYMSRSAHYPLLVVAGSFHVRQQNSEHYVNQAPIIARGGESFASYCKAYRYHAAPNEYRSPAETVRREEELLERARAVYEDPAQPNVGEAIQVGDRGLVLETDAGRIGILVCVDLLKANKLVQLYADLGVNYLLVPSMTPQANRFRTMAKGFSDSSRGYVCFSNSPVSFNHESEIDARTEHGSFISCPVGPRGFRIASTQRIDPDLELSALQQKHAVLDPTDLYVEVAGGTS